MTEPVVSVICTVYNKENFLPKTLDSLLEQKTSFSFEVIIIDDASTDYSRNIIEEYQTRYPELIRTFYNEENLGIALTWKQVCQEARGKYIARCDGDDIWLDNEKLQKQYRALRENSEYRWSTTDICFINQDNQITEDQVFSSGQMPLITSYEVMLASRGFTAPSTWLIERELMLEVNNEMDPSTADDTFDMQLDLFQRTKKLFLPEAMVAYRIHEGSDSRPKDFEALQKRFNRLLETQLFYVDKYPQSNFKEMVKFLLERINTYEIYLSRPTNSLSHIGIEKLTVYFADRLGDFSQEHILQKLLQLEDEVSFRLPPECRRLRVDLSELPSFYSQVSLLDVDNNTEILPSASNGFTAKNFYFFPQHDPQLLYDLRDYHGKNLILRYKMLNIDDPVKSDYVAVVLGKELEILTRQLERQAEDKAELEKMKQENHRLQKDIENITLQYNSVVHSRRWTLSSKILNIFKKRK